MKRGAALVFLFAVISVARGTERNDEFPHDEHINLFPTCETCHELDVQGQPTQPDAVSCSACHDGDVEDEVEWQPPSQPPSLLEFNHRDHADTVLADGDSTSCSSCHGNTEEWQVEAAAAVGCASCHEGLEDHPDGSAACAECHTTLARSSLTSDQVAMLPAPAGHEGGFALDHSGAMELNPTSCATCHARDFCIQCHVNGPETPEIARLEPDARSLAFSATVPTPETHQQHDFVLSHETSDLSTCATCHTQESCTSCHLNTTEEFSTLYAAGPGRSPGPVMQSSIPPEHDAGFIASFHGTAAAADPLSCATCHVRSECVDCHQPDDSSDRSYHPVGFSSLHPAEAYRRATSCADCHSTGGFCQSCHESAGVTGSGAIDAGFHDAKAAFGIGHGPAARTSLESCVSCHVEQDCLACHSIVSGRGFNPHGPGFDAARLRSKNFESCTVCHGAAVPAGS